MMYTDECYCDECNALRCDYPAWALTWKRAAKVNRDFYNHAIELAKRNQLKWHKAQADADRRRELLKLFEIQRNEALMPCPKCETITMYHELDCELARELADE